MLSSARTMAQMLMTPLGLFEFGMDRVSPHWVQMKYGAPVLHLGPGMKGQQHYTIDCEWPEYDFEDEHSLSSFPDGTVGGVVATHVLEHLRDPRPLIWEVARVLAPGRPFNIVVPKAGSNLFWQDLDHKTGFVLDTWRTLLDTSYYSKGKNANARLRVGFNAEMAIKEGNVAIVTQLIKE